MPAMSRQLYHSSERRAGKAHSLQLDSPALMAILVLLVTGLLALFTASYATAYYTYGNSLYFISRQALFAVIGVAAMLFISHVNYHIYGNIQKLLFVVALGLLAVVPFIGSNVKGATRWIDLGPIGFQPSELMKIALIISFAWYASRAGKKIRTFRYGVLPYYIVMFLIAGLLYLEPHMSATIIILAIGTVILFVAGIRLWYFIPLGGVGAMGVIWYISTKGYAMDRVSVWLNPFVDLAGDGWQGAMSQIAIGSGGLFGLGLGQGHQKYLYLPEPQNDFIFSNFCEELGLVGAVLVLLLFAYLIYRGFYIARSAPDKFGCLLATGITAKLAIQTLINLFVVTGIMPVTGASLPLFSYGGTALLMQLFEFGVLLNISRHARIPKSTSESAANEKGGKEEA